MSAMKRKTLEPLLVRRVKARRSSKDEIEDNDSGSVASVPSSSTEHSANDSPDKIREGGTEEEDRDSATSQLDDSDSEPEKAELTEISFGALAKAQASVRSRHNRTGSSPRADMENADGWGDNEAQERKAGRDDQRHFNRSSKHAPTEMSSKKAVSRKRDIVPVAKREHRDPRFDSSVGTVDETKVKRAYSFLTVYRETEMQELKEAIQKTKDLNEKENLKRELLRMESRKKAEDRKSKEEEVLTRHKKEEKELVKHGKQPFYLREAEKKKRVLLERYNGMKKGQLDHAIERRRKKVEGKEKKRLPYARRNAGVE